VDTRASDTRARIQQVALELFMEQGCTNTSIREIAERLGVTKAALYYHFRTKDELIGSLATPFLDGFAELLTIAQEQDGDEMSRPLVEGYLDLLLAQRPLVGWLREDYPARLHPTIGPVLESLGDRLKALMGGAEMPFDKQVRVTAALGALGVGVSEFPAADSDDLRGPLLQAARAVLDASERMAPDTVGLT